VEALDRSRRSVLGKALLLASSLLVAFCLIEYLIVPRLLMQAPHRYQHGFSLLMQVVSQHSKRELIPRDYVLLVGDSNAKGYGEWLGRAAPEGQDPYHSAHVIRDRLQRDVLSYGKGGAGSIAGLLLFPARWDHALARRGLDPPDTVAIYFYEGNDLNDNLRYLRNHFPGGPESESVMDDATLDAFLREELADYVGKKSALDSTFSAAYVWKNVRGGIESWWRAGPQVETPEPGPAAPATEALPSEKASAKLRTNRARIAGEVIALPEELQSPALELTREELARTLQVTRRSLALLIERYPSSEVILFRIPSPIASYEIVSDTVDVQSYEHRASVYPASRVETYSTAIGDALAGFAVELGIDYVDLRPAVRAATRELPIHGPVDWKHLNEDGYTVLGEAVSSRIASGEGSGNGRSASEVTP
jgi:hypothetical protein